MSGDLSQHTEESLYALNRREIQALAKLHGIAANIKTAAIIEALLEIKNEENAGSDQDNNASSGDDPSHDSSDELPQAPAVYQPPHRRGTGSPVQNTRGTSRAAPPQPVRRSARNVGGSQAFASIDRRNARRSPSRPQSQGQPAAGPNVGESEEEEDSPGAAPSVAAGPQTPIDIDRAMARLFATPNDAELGSGSPEDLVYLSPAAQPTNDRIRSNGPRTPLAEVEAEATASRSTPHLNGNGRMSSWQPKRPATPVPHGQLHRSAPENNPNVLGPPFVAAANVEAVQEEFSQAPRTPDRARSRSYTPTSPQYIPTRYPGDSPLSPPTSRHERSECPPSPHPQAQQALRRHAAPRPSNQVAAQSQQAEEGGQAPSTRNMFSYPPGNPWSPRAPSYSPTGISPNPPPQALQSPPRDAEAALLNPAVVQPSQQAAPAPSQQPPRRPFGVIRDDTRGSGLAPRIYDAQSYTASSAAMREREASNANDYGRSQPSSRRRTGAAVTGESSGQVAAPAHPSTPQRQQAAARGKRKRASDSDSVYGSGDEQAQAPRTQNNNLDPEWNAFYGSNPRTSAPVDTTFGREPVGRQRQVLPPDVEATPNTLHMYYGLQQENGGSRRGNQGEQESPLTRTRNMNIGDYDWNNSRISEAPSAHRPVLDKFYGRNRQSEPAAPVPSSEIPPGLRAQSVGLPQGASPEDTDLPPGLSLRSTAPPSTRRRVLDMPTPIIGQSGRRPPVPLWPQGSPHSQRRSPSRSPYNASALPMTQASRIEPTPPRPAPWAPPQNNNPGYAPMDLSMAVNRSDARRMAGPSPRVIDMDVEDGDEYEGGEEESNKENDSPRGLGYPPEEGDGDYEEGHGEAGEQVEDYDPRYHTPPNRPRVRGRRFRRGPSSSPLPDPRAIEAEQNGVQQQRPAQPGAAEQPAQPHEGQSSATGDSNATQAATPTPVRLERERKARPDYFAPRPVKMAPIMGGDGGPRLYKPHVRKFRRIMAEQANEVGRIAAEVDDMRLLLDESERSLLEARRSLERSMAISDSLENNLLRHWKKNPALRDGTAHLPPGAREARHAFYHKKYLEDQRARAQGQMRGMKRSHGEVEEDGDIGEDYELKEGDMLVTPPRSGGVAVSDDSADDEGSESGTQEDAVQQASGSGGGAGSDNPAEGEGSGSGTQEGAVEDENPLDAPPGSGDSMRSFYL